MFWMQSLLRRTELETFPLPVGTTTPPDDPRFARFAGPTRLGNPDAMVGSNRDGEMVGEAAVPGRVPTFHLYIDGVAEHGPTLFTSWLPQSCRSISKSPLDAGRPPASHSLHQAPASKSKTPGPQGVRVFFFLRCFRRKSKTFIF